MTDSEGAVADRFIVIPTPRGMWPFKVWDTARDTEKASVNSREDAEHIAAKYNARSERQP